MALPRTDSFVEPTYADVRWNPRTWSGVLRCRQWVKNVLIFLPMFTAHQLMDAKMWVSAAWAFVAFSLCASGIYIVNDLMDLEADRAHPMKKLRPFASGAFPLAWGRPLACTLLASGLGLAFSLSSACGFLVASYVIASMAYTFWIKSMLAMDVIVLAGLYALRTLVGSVATGIPVTKWLLEFLLFFFLSLAFLKRFSETRLLRELKGYDVAGRAYRADHCEVLMGSGLACSFGSILVYAGYVTSDAVNKLYTRPDVLWFSAPIMAYAFARVWLLASRGDVDHDPVDFVLKDRPTQVAGLLIGVVTYLAS